VCEQPAQGRYLAVPRLEVKPATCSVLAGSRTSYLMITSPTCYR